MKTSDIIGILWIIVAVLLIFVLALRLNISIYLFLLSILVGMIFVDFISGLVHWLGDTWGDENWPILGKSFIQPFREHHVDQKLMCKHDFLETNVNNAIVVIIFLSVVLIFFHNQFLYSTALVISIFSLFTNQIHKWAHSDKVNPFVKFLQKNGLILSPKRHELHHSGKHDEHYSITNGWTNKFLKKIHFYRGLEKVITFFTGALPRGN